MKRLIIVLLAMLLLTGCTQPVIEPTSSPEDTQRPTAEATLAATKEPSPSPSGELVSSATVTVGEGSMIIMVVLENGILKGNVICMFDGANAGTEAEYTAAVMLYFEELDIVNYIIGGISGDDTIMVAMENGETTNYSHLPESYKVIVDPDRTLEYTKEIASVMANQSPQTSETAPETTAPGYILIHEDEYVKIEYIKCEKGSYRDEIVFYVENKTSVELTFQSGAMAVDGESLGYISGSDSIAASSRGKIRFAPTEDLPTYTPDKITGTIRVIDFSKTVFGKKQSYDVKFTNVDVG